MKTERPILKVPLKHIDIAVELLSIALLLLMWLYIITEYHNLPDIIASHFNVKGQPDDYANKGFLWFIPTIGTVLYVALLYLNRYPHKHNYTVNITPENAFKHYQFSTRVLRTVNFLCLLLFAYITYAIIKSAKNGQSELGFAFIYIVIGISILLPVIIIIYKKKLNS